MVKLTIQKKGSSTECAVAVHRSVSYHWSVDVQIGRDALSTEMVRVVQEVTYDPSLGFLSPQGDWGRVRGPSAFRVRGHGNIPPSPDQFSSAGKGPASLPSSDTGVQS